MKDTIATVHTTAGHTEHQFYKAQGVAGRPVESVVIIFEYEIPEVNDDDWIEGAREYYEGDGQLLERTLFETMPGGSYDALLRAMLLRRASLLRVRWIPAEVAGRFL